MSGPSQSAPAAAQPYSPSTLAALGSGLAAVLVQLALLDAAVETFWSGSPLRWWIALAVVAFAALSAWLWRPGGEGAKRWGARGAAWWSFWGLLLLLTVSAWFPDGQTNGVRMLLQPTATVLTAAMAVAVVLAGYALVRALALAPASARLICQAAVVALGLYALLALGAGLYARTPFAALFHGGAMWQRLPRWLQGPFIGAFLLVPLAVVFQALRLVDHRRRNVPVRLLFHQTTALVMSVVMALSGITFPVRPAATEQIQTDAAPVAVETALAELNQSRTDFAELITGAGKDAASQAPVDPAKLAAIYAGLEEVSRSLPRESFDPEAVAKRVGPDPVKLFEWVRDNTSLVPYRGVLRGPVGVLMDRLGNSLDRALLLAKLLEIAGLETQLAHATISPAQAQSLVSRAPSDRRTDTTADEAAALLATVSPILGTDTASLRRRMEAFGESASTFAAAVSAQADARSKMLLAAVGKKPEPAKPDGVDPVLDHWWVQVQRDGTWVDLDPSEPTARPGTTLAPAAKRVRPDDLPADLFHQVDIRVVVEQRLNGRLKEQIALSKALRPSALAGRSIMLTHIPLSTDPNPELVRLNAGLAQRLATAAQQEAIWLPALSVGEEIVAQKIVSTTGQMEDLPAGETESGAGGPTAPPAGGLVGFLGGGEEPQPKAETLDMAKVRARLTRQGDLTAEWIEYAIAVPGKQPRVIRREVFDLLGPAARKAGTIGRSISDGDRFARGLALFSETEVLLLASRLSQTYVSARKAQAMLDNRAPLEALLLPSARLDDKQAMDLIAKMSAPPGPVFDLALMRNVAVPQSENMFLAEPNILSFHTGMIGSDLSALRGFHAFDIVWNQVHVQAGAKDDPFDVRVRQGTFDSVAEELILKAGCCGNEPAALSGAISAGRELGAGLRVLRAESELSGVPILPDLRERVGEALRAGNLVVIPVAPGTQSGWWTIDRTTGTTLFIGPQGWGQASEYVAKLKAIALMHINAWGAFVFKLAALGVCAAASMVGAAAGGPTHSAAANVGIAAFGVALCLVAFGLGFTALAVAAHKATSGEIALRVGSILVELIGLALEWAYHQIEATREGVKEKEEQKSPAPAP